MAWYCTVFFKKKSEGGEGDFSMRSLHSLSRNDKGRVIGSACPERSRMGRNDKAGVADSARMTRWLA
jgi:hypothetical protein